MGQWRRLLRLNNVEALSLNSVGCIFCIFVSFLNVFWHNYNPISYYPVSNSHCGQCTVSLITTTSATIIITIIGVTVVSSKPLTNIYIAAARHIPRNACLRLPPLWSFPPWGRRILGVGREVLPAVRFLGSNWWQSILGCAAGVITVVINPLR